MLEIGSLVDGKYKILNEIGHGGMSIVYLAIVERANQTWAIKEVRKNGATKDDIVQQGLVAEMNILKRLHHDHLPRIIDIIDYDDSFLIVMDYIEGIDLDKKLKEGPQKWEDVLEWSKQLCDVLAYLHTRTPPIIYRDMKPGNVKLKPSGDVVLFDFGTAREYKSQKAGDDTTCLGTRGYASPEQYGGMGQTDARSDIYCLGATMFHLITGRVPGGPPDYSIPPIRTICPWLPKTGKAGDFVRGIEQIIWKCTQQNPADRYQNCAELMYDLENADKISFDYLQGLRRKVKTWIACIASAAVLAAGGGILGYAATRTVATNYSEHLAAANSSTTAKMSPGEGDYQKVESELKKAIAIDPTDARAWLYLAKLYRSDFIVSNDEYNQMEKSLGEANGTKFKTNDPGYTQFCYEWGSDLYFFYHTGSGQGSITDTGDPEKANSYFSYVTKDNREVGVSKLIAEYNDTYSQNPSFKLADVSQTVAENEYDMAEQLLTISKMYGSLGQSDAYTQGYPYSTYWNDLTALIDTADGLNASAAAVNIGLVRASVYSCVINSIKDRFSYFTNDGVPVTSISDMIARVRSKNSSLRSSLDSVLLASLNPLLDNIDNQCNDAEQLCLSVQ